MTLRFRLILWFTGTLTVILLIFCGALIWLQPQVDIATLDDELSNDIVTVGGVLSTEVGEVGHGAQAVADMLDELRLPQRGIGVFDRAGHCWAPNGTGSTAKAWACRQRRQVRGPTLPLKGTRGCASEKS